METSRRAAPRCGLRETDRQEVVEGSEHIWLQRKLRARLGRAWDAAVRAVAISC